MSIAATADLWWKNAVIYCLDVQTFADSDGDGIGDFGGLTERIDYLAGLGITCLWLMPFYPTADLDDGYDISDHYAIDPRLGTSATSPSSCARARDRGMRVIADLVVNHTSDQHPWFQAARAEPGVAVPGVLRVAGRDPRRRTEGEVFPGEQTGVWTFDPEAGQYYLHRFYHHQPDLNVASEPGADEIRKVIGFWMAQGLSGFRVDAVPFLLEVDGIDEEMEVDPHQYLRDLRAFISAARRRRAARRGQPAARAAAAVLRRRGRRRAPHAVRLPRHAGHLPGPGPRDARPDRQVRCGGARRCPANRRWRSFLRNHDELTLDKLTDAERQEVFDAFGPDPDMQLYGRGLRRRLPTMLDGDPRWIRMAYSLMFSMPGTPTLFYGEEIGMGENLEIEGRLAVRTPMQWDDGPTAGFTTAPADSAAPAVPHRRTYGPDAVNVADQRTDPRVAAQLVRAADPPAQGAARDGMGHVDGPGQRQPRVLALRFDWDGRTAVTAHNLSRRTTIATIDLDGTDDGVLEELLSADVPAIRRAQRSSPHPPRSAGPAVAPTATTARLSYVFGVCW